MKMKRMIAALLVAAGTLTACSSTPSDQSTAQSEQVQQAEEGETVDLGGLIDDSVPLSGSPAVSTVLTPVASGSSVKKSGSATVDMSNKTDGYIMVKFGNTDKKLKVRVTGPSGTTYTYNLTGNDTYETFPLSDGNGKYTVEVFKNIQDTKYSKELSTSFEVTLKDEFAPFLRPNQYVNYTEDSQAVALAAELTAGMTDNLQKVKTIYDYVVQNISYDRLLAAKVQSGYLPDIDQVLAKKKGICFDYAALMSAMLRSQEVPTKLVVGYTGSVYHAWINVYSEEEGWIDAAIYFDGQEWKLMDPTFASSNNSSQAIMKYIGNGANYQAKYLY